MNYSGSDELQRWTSKLQRWWNTPAAMNLSFSMRICTPPKNTQKVTPYVGDELSYSKKCPKRDSLCWWWSLISKNAKKSFSVGDEVSVFSTSKVSGTTTVTPFPVWCACSLNRKIPFPKTFPKTASWMLGSSFLAWPVVMLPDVRLFPKPSWGHVPEENGSFSKVSSSCRMHVFISPGAHVW